MGVVINNIYVIAKAPKFFSTKFHMKIIKKKLKAKEKKKKKTASNYSK